MQDIGRGILSGLEQTLARKLEMDRADTLRQAEALRYGEELRRVRAADARAAEIHGWNAKRFAHEESLYPLTRRSAELGVEGQRLSIAHAEAMNPKLLAQADQGIAINNQTITSNAQAISHRNKINPYLVQQAEQAVESGRNAEQRAQNAEIRARDAERRAWDKHYRGEEIHDYTLDGLQEQVRLAGVQYQAAVQALEHAANADARAEAQLKIDQARLNLEKKRLALEEKRLGMRRGGGTDLSKGGPSSSEIERLVQIWGASERDTLINTGTRALFDAKVPWQDPDYVDVQEGGVRHRDLGTQWAEAGRQTRPRIATAVGDNFDYLAPETRQYLRSAFEAIWQADAADNANKKNRLYNLMRAAIPGRTFDELKEIAWGAFWRGAAGYPTFGPQLPGRWPMLPTPINRPGLPADRMKEAESALQGQGRPGVRGGGSPNRGGARRSWGDTTTPGSTKMAEVEAVLQ